MQDLTIHSFLLTLYISALEKFYYIEHNIHLRYFLDYNFLDWFNDGQIIIN